MTIRYALPMMLLVTSCAADVTTIGQAVVAFDDDSGATSDSGTSSDSGTTFDGGDPGDSTVVLDTDVPDSTPIPDAWTVVPAPSAAVNFTTVVTVGGHPWFLGLGTAGLPAPDSGVEAGTSIHSTVLLRDATSWISPIDFSFFAYSMWASDAGDLYLAGEKTIQHFGELAVSVPGELHAVWGTDPDHVFAGGINALYEWNATAWQDKWAAAPFDEIQGIWGSSADDVWAVTYGSRLRHRTLGGWGSPVESLATPQALNGIWGSAADDVWVVGNHGTILRYHVFGDAGLPLWEQIASPTTADLVGVSGTDANDVWIVGKGGTILHFDGTLSVFKSPTTEDLASVKAVSKTSAWACGKNVILRYGT